MRYIMILNDGETFTDLHGCKIAEVPDNFDFDTPKGWGYPVVTEFTEIDGVVLVMQRYPFWKNVQVSEETLRKGT